MNSRRFSSFIAAVIFIAIVFFVLDRTRIVVWVQTPWWVVLIGAVILFLVIDLVVSRIFKRD